MIKIDEDLKQKIELVADSFLTAMNVELVDLIIRPVQGQVHIEMLADKSEGRISLDECAALNRKIGDALEASNLIPDQYILEVSSPGLDRQLKTKRDFERAVGKEVRFLLSALVEGKLEHLGIIKRVENDSVIIEVKELEVIIPIGLINKAKQII